MRKSLFKKITAAVVSLTMVVGSAGIVSAATTHAANGANVAKQSWTGFSVCYDPSLPEGQITEWEQELQNLRTDDYPNGQVKGTDYATEGWVVPGSTSSNMEFYVKSSGWDGEYNPAGDLIGDNPWGLWAAMTGIPVENERYYTISFNIRSTLSVTTTEKDEQGNEIEKEITTKKILFKAYDPISRGEPSVEFINITGASPDGSIILQKDKTIPIKATIKIPAKKIYSSNVMGVKFAMGAYLKTRPEENNLKGSVFVTDFKIVAGDQYKVTYTNGKSSLSTYVNKNGYANSTIVLPKKGYTLTGYKLQNGAKYNFYTPVTKDTVLTAIYAKTKKPSKPKVTTKSTGRRKISVKIAKVKNASGYEIQYSNKANMKGAKKKNVTKAKTYTIKKLTSRKYVYVKVRAFTYDSANNKVFGKLSVRKRVFVK